jgi:hypothetical protein
VNPMIEILEGIAEPCENCGTRVFPWASRPWERPKPHQFSGGMSIPDLGVSLGRSWTEHTTAMCRNTRASVFERDIAPEERGA